MKKLKELSEGDMAVCKMFAALRTAANRRNEVTRPFSTDAEKHMEQEENAVRAEYAFCRHHNIFFDGAFGGKDSGSDCVLRGRAIDIKSIAEPHLNLICHHHTDKSMVDLYVLVLVESNICSIVGWAYKEEFIKEENLTDLGYGPVYLLRQQQLRPWTNG